MKLDRLSIEVPKHDARRDRVIGSVLAKVAAMRTAERADAVMAEPRSRMRLAIAFAAPLALAATAAVWLLVARAPVAPGASPSAPSLVVTPIGGSSRFTVGDSMIEAGPDTSVEVLTAADGAVTLALARGSVECDVAPRDKRPPFRVIAGDVTVEVVGTRFTVARRPDVRVDVARGKVKVIAPAGTSYVLPGESWPALAAAPAPVLAPAAPPPSPLPPAASAPAPRSPQAIFKDAQRLRQRDPAASERLYRTLANNRDVWAALSLYDLAEMHGSAQIDRALSELDELARRFPRAANLEDAAWLRIELLRKAGRTEDARHAAAAYLRRFPSGTYVDQAARVAAP